MRLKALWSEWEAQHYARSDGRALGGCVSYPCLVTDEHAASSHGLPVIVIDGQALGTAEVPPGEAQVPSIVLDLVRRAGYPAQALDDGPRERYWAEALPVSEVLLWTPQGDVNVQPAYPDARLVLY